MKYSPSKSKGNVGKRESRSVNTLSSFKVESFDGIVNETDRHCRPILSELVESTKMFSDYLSFSSL